MTSDPQVGARASGLRVAGALGILGLAVAASPAVRAADTYPFEGSWIRANRVCTPNAPRLRVYSAHDVSSPSGRCTFRKVASGGGQFEIFEDCRRSDVSGGSIEVLRMLGMDALQVRRQVGRLKIARPLRYTRCPPPAQPPVPTRMPPTGQSRRPGIGTSVPAEPPRPGAPKP